MLQDYSSASHQTLSPGEDTDLLRLRSAGRQAAKSLVLLPPRRAAYGRLKERAHTAARTIQSLSKHKSLASHDARWLIENYRLINAAIKDSAQLPASLIH